MNQRRSRKTKREQRAGFKPASPSPPRRKESPQPHVLFVAWVTLAGIVGLLCVVGLGLTLHHIGSIAERQALVRSLPDVTRTAPGETAILDGRIAATEPPRYKEFVTYIRERRPRGGTRIVGKQTPAFAVDTGGRVYTIANTDYAFDRLLWNWTDHHRVDEEPTAWKGAVTIRGIVAGAPVMAVGRLVPREGGALDFQADSLVGLSRSTYFDRLTEAREISWRLAGTLALLAPILIYVGWRGVRRIMR